MCCTAICSMQSLVSTGFGSTHQGALTGRLAHLHGAVLISTFGPRNTAGEVAHPTSPGILLRPHNGPIPRLKTLQRCWLQQVGHFEAVLDGVFKDYDVGSQTKQSTRKIQVTIFKGKDVRSPS